MGARDTSMMRGETIPSFAMSAVAGSAPDSLRGRRRLWVHAAVFVLALAARLAFQTTVVGLATPPRDDALLYDSIATRLTQGGPYVDAEGYRSRRAPGFPILLAGVYSLVGHSWPAARVTQAVVGALTCSVLLTLGSSWLGARIGVTAALACAVYPHAILWTGSLVSEPLCALLTTATIAALTRARDSLRWTAGWSCLSALATLTRPNMGFLLPLGLLWLLGVPGRRWLRTAVALVVFCLVLLPWGVRNYRVHGRFVPLTTMGGLVLWEGNNAIVAADPGLRGRFLPGGRERDEAVSRLPETEQDRVYFERALHYMRTSPGDMPALVGSKLLRLWNPFPELDSALQRWLAPLAFLPVLGLFAAGLFLAIRCRDGRILPLLAPVLAVTLTAAIYWADGRIRSPADPVILLVASYGLWGVLDRFQPSRRVPA